MAAQAGERFPITSRLRRPEQFRLALRSRRRNRGDWFTLSASPNSAGHVRLGIVVPRRVVPRAVDRNRLKRLVREAFRRMSSELAALDLVIQVHGPAPNRLQAGAARAELVRLLEYLRE